MTHAERAIPRAPADADLTVLRGCSRRGLLSTTALQAVAVVAVLALIQPARAQLSPMARPVGGQVVAGQASIAQTANKTTITQTTQNAAVNWQSYNIGSGQTVQYIDPSSKSITLNRVVGANPSEIAGRIISNGTVMIINQAGLLFDGSAQINTAGLVVSAAGISNSNFMAGKMVFDQAPNPGAKIENRGTITIKDRGLAVLVAPQVVNSGVIRANLGKVILAGAETSVLDLYGDGMVSINVTKQVATAPDRGAALVTNTGVITASGGTVLLTAQAVDGVVQTLVNAGGTIAADSVPGQTGRVLISGAGGDVVVVGTVAANGRAPGTTGGTVVVNTTGNVVLASSANVLASGPAGGGLVAVGTTVKRATGGPSVTGQKTAKAVTIAKGAVIDASASTSGNGGRVVLLATDRTTMAGTISAMGGPLGGDGGFVEISGGLLALSGHVEASAPHGVTGTLFLDPLDLYVSDTQPAAAIYPVIAGDLPVTAGAAPDASTTSWVSPAVLQGMNANISLATTRDLFVASGSVTTNTLTLGSHTLTLVAGANLTIDRGFTISAGGISLTATSGNITLDGISGVGAGLISAPQIAALGPTSLQASVGANLTMVAGNTIAFDTAIVGSSATPWATIDLTAGNGGVTQAATGTLVAGTLQSTGGIVGSASLLGTANAIGTIAAIAVTGAGSDFALTDSANLTVSGALTAVRDVRLTATGASSITVTGSIGAGDTLAATSGSGGIALNTGAILTGPTIVLDGAAGGIALTGTAALGNASTAVIDLSTSGGGVTEAVTAAITGTTLQSTGGIVGGAALTGTNTIATIGSVAVSGGNFSLSDTGSLSVTGLVSGPNISLNAGTIGIAGTLNATTLVALGASAGGITEAGSIIAGTLSSLGTIVGGAALTGTNVIGTLASVSTDTFSLKDGTSLSVTGPLTIGTSVSIVDIGTLLVSGSITPSGTASISVGLTASALNITGLVSDGGAGTTSLVANTGSIEESGGRLIAGTLSGSAAGTAALIGVNTVGTLANFAVTGAANSFELTDTTALRVTGTVTAPGNIYLQDSNTGITIAASGGVGAGTSQRVGFQTDGLTIVSGGTVTGGTFELAPNTVGGTMNVGSNGGSSLLSVSGIGPTNLRLGAITAPGASSITTTAGSISFAGGFGAGTIVLELDTTGAITQGAGAVLTVGTLTGNAGGTVGLLGTANAIGTVAAFAVTGTTHDFTLMDTGNLAVSGALTATQDVTLRTSGTGAISATGSIGAGRTLSATSGSGGIALNTGAVLTGPAIVLNGAAGGIALTGNASLGQSGGLVDLTASGTGITEATTSTITAATLQSSGGVAGTVGLLGTANAIGTITALTLIGTLTVVDSQALTLAGLVNVGNAGTVDIHTTAGGITQASTGTLVAGRLTSTGGIAGAAILQGISNQIGTISGVTAGGTLTVVDSQALTLAGLVGSGNTGLVDITTTAGGVTQASTGTLIAGTLLSSGGIKGAVLLQGTANQISNLGSAASTPGALLATGAIAITDSVDLIIAGNVIAGSSGSLAPPTTSLSITLPGNKALTVNGQAIAASSAGSVTLTAGSITLAQSGTVVPEVEANAAVVLSATTTLLQTAGAINGGSVSLTAPVNATLANGTIVASTGTIGVFTPSATVSAGEIIAALNTANSVSFSGNLTQAASSYIGSNGTIVVGSLLTENGGTLLSVGNVTLGSLSQSAGTIATGGNLTIGSGTGVAGIIGSSVTAGTFAQSGGVLAAKGNANIFTTGTFAQSAGAVLATGGTLGATATQGIDIGGTVSAAGTATGFMLLANGGNAVLETTGLLGGAALSVPGDTIPGNALQAPAGTVRIAGTSGTQAFGRAGPVGPIAAVNGYVIVPPANPPAFTRLSSPAIGAPALATATPVKLNGGTIDLERPVTASTLGLFATTSITEGPFAVINAIRLTGSSAADVSLLSATNTIGTLGDFNNAGFAFNLVDASNLMLTGVLSAKSVQITDANFSIDLTGTVSATNSIKITAGGTTEIAGLLSANNVVINAGGVMDLGAGSAFSGLGAGSSSPLNTDVFPLPGSAGVYLQASNFTVTANPAITTGSTINWTFALAGNGNVGLGNVGLGNFQQPSVKLFMDLASGTAAGQVNVAGLQVRYTTPTTTTIDLIGSIGGVSGTTAASNAHISPLPKNNYQINGCPISSVNCIKFTGLTVPVVNRLQEVQFGRLQTVSDIDVALPDVAERDY